MQVFFPRRVLDEIFSYTVIFFTRMIENMLTHIPAF